MRIGLVCPYSLTVPGGVQGQVLGLARSLRASGHEVRVLAPCDGPPPDAGVTPLGHSVPTAANGSVAPLAPDPPAQLRTSGPCATRASTSSTCTSRSPPAPRMTALRAPAGARWSARSTPPASVGQLPVGPARGALAGRPPRPPLRGVATTPRRWRRRTSAATYELLFNGIEVDRFAEGDADAHRRPDDLLPRPPRAPQGPRVLLDAMARCPPTCGCGWAATGPRPSGSAAAVAGDPRIEWLGRDQRRREALAAAGRRRLLRAVAAGRVVRRGAARGHGGVDRRRGQRPRRLPQRRPARRQDALLVPPGDADGAGRGPATACSPTPACGRGAGGRRASARAAELLDGPPGRALRRALRAGRRGRRRRAREARLRRRISGGHPVATCAEVQSTWASP